MGLTLNELLPDFKASLNDAATVFAPDDTDFARQLRTAAAALAREKRPRTALAQIQVQPGQAEYPDVPDDLIAPKVCTWAHGGTAVWHLPPTPPPALTVLGEGTGRVLLLTPAPTPEQIKCWGSTLRYYYLAEHRITDSALTSTIQSKDRALLYLRAQMEAMRELSFRNYKKPITLRGGDGLGGAVASKNQTPPALWDLLRQEYEAAQ